MTDAVLHGRAQAASDKASRAVSAAAGTPPRIAKNAVWVAAFVGAAVLHAGLLGFVWWKAQTPDDSDALGAPAIEVSLALTAPREEQENLPIGPAAEESSASTAAAEQHQKIEKIEAPKEKPKESEDAERVVAPEIPKEEKKETPDKVETKAQSAQDSVASEAAAPPKIETAKEAPKSTAPSPGTGISAQRIRMTWQRTLVAHINRHKRYPAAIAQKPMEITVSFTLDRSGHVVASSVEKSSGNEQFDQAALAMMRRADPVPPPPPTVADEGLTFSIPVIFQRVR